MLQIGRSLVRSQLVSLEFFIYIKSFRSHYGPGVDSASVPGAFPGGKGGRCIRLTTLPPSCAIVMKSGNLNFLEPSGPLQACKGTALPFFTIQYIYRAPFIIFYCNQVIHNYFIKVYNTTVFCVIYYYTITQKTVVLYIFMKKLYISWL